MTRLSRIIVIGLFMTFGWRAGAEVRVQGDAAFASLGKTSFRFDLRTGGSIVSLRRGEREFVKGDGKNPPVLYALECFDGAKTVTLTGRDADRTCADAAADSLTIRTQGHKGLPISVTATVRLDETEGLSLWNIEVENHTGLGILSVEYPCIFTPNSLGDIADDRILAKGMLTNFPDPVKGYWNWSEVYWGLKHPQAAMQFAAFYDPACGLYLASQDTEGYMKRNNILRIVDQMKFAHTFRPEYSKGDSYKSPYPIAITTFEGKPTTWQDAADIYRRWVTRQWWCKTRWFERADVPRWLKEGAGVIVPRNYPKYAEEGESYYKYLWVEGKRYSEAAGGKNTIVLFHSWAEGKTRATQLGHPKPVPHDPFKGVGLFKEACAQMRANRCFPFVFIAAPDLYVHTFGGGDYDNKDLYLGEAKRYEVLPEKVFLKQAETPKEVPTLVRMCPGTEYWRECVRKECLQLVDLGVDVVQLDGFPVADLCYNPDHGHPLGGGSWYYQSWKRLIEQVQAECRKKNPDFVLTMEWPCELYIPLVQLTMKRWGLAKTWMVGEGMVPVYEYVYGDFDKSYGGEGDSTHIGPATASPPGKDDAADYTSFGMARNLCYGLFPTIAFGLDKESLDPATRSEYHLAFYRDQIAAMGGYAQKYLLRGHMIHDWAFENPQANVRYWGWWLKPPRTDVYPYRAIVHAAWQAPDKDVAGFFVNITNKPRRTEVEIPAVSGLKTVQIAEYISGKKQVLSGATPLPTKVKLDLPPSAFVMLEAHGL